MKLTLKIALIAFLFAKIGFAQEDDKKISQLTFLFVDEKYDKLVDKAGFMMESDKYKRNPLVYAYLAMGYFEIAKNPDQYDIEEKYKKPLKNAQKYAYKFVKKDKKNEYVAEYKDFLQALKDTSNKLAQHYYIIGKYSKANSIYKTVMKFSPDDPIMKLWAGIAYIRNNNANEGERLALEALAEIDENFQPDEVTAPVLPEGLLIISEYFANKGDYQSSEKAKKMVEVFKKYDPEEMDKAKKEAKRKKELEKEVEIRKFYSDDDDSDDDEE
jgi:hypothetical protein